MITSLANPLVKQARALRQRKARVETGLFLVEGIHHVGEVIEAGWVVETILFAPDLLTSSFANDLLERAARLTLRTQPVSAKVMESLAEKDNPQGILAIVRQKRIKLDDISPIKRGVALVSPQDPGNVGAILRTMEAVDADTLFLLDGGVEPFHPTTVRASMGTLFWIPIVEMDFNEFVKWTKNGGYSLIGTSAHATKDYRQYKFDIPWILVFGNEQKGLSPQQAAACTEMVCLPMRGRVSSLNLSVAAGVLLYQFTDDS